MGKPAWQTILDEPDPDRRKTTKEISAPEWVLDQNADPEPSGLVSMEDAHALENLLDYMLTVPEKAVIEAMIFAGHSTRHTADMLGIPTTTVHRLKVSALAKLREFYEQYANE